jgi:hypothetical protein
MKAHSRRGFLRQAGALAAGVMGFPWVIRSTVLGLDGAIAPSNRITLGCIGIGWQGGENLKSFLEQSGCRVIAVCDVDDDHLQNAKKYVDQFLLGIPVSSVASDNFAGAYYATKHLIDLHKCPVQHFGISDTPTSYSQR